MSVKRSETVVMNLHVIGNTFVNIRKNCHTLHFHHFDWLQLNLSLSLTIGKIFGQVGPGLCDAASGYRPLIRLLGGKDFRLCVVRLAVNLEEMQWQKEIIPHPAGTTHWINVEI